VLCGTISERWLYITVGMEEPTFRTREWTALIAGFARFLPTVDGQGFLECFLRIVPAFTIREVSKCCFSVVRCGGVSAC